MSFSTEPTPVPPQPRAPSLSLKSVILLALVGVCVLAAVTIFVSVLFSRRGGGGSAAPLEQHATVSPQGKYTGAVNYPVPFGLPPNLTLTSSGRKYDILKQDEKGFTWQAQTLADDFKDDKQREAESETFRNNWGFLHATNKLKPNIQFEDFTWTAKGVPEGKDTIFPQEGTFNTVAGLEGMVNFPIPYENAPNVELSGPANVLGVVVIVESRPTGFKWKNTGKEGMHSGTLSWKAKGIKATR